MVHAIAMGLRRTVVWRIGLIGAFILLAGGAVPVHAQFTQLHDLDFPSGNYPYGKPVIKDGFIYDVARFGGTSGFGVVYRIKTDGTLYTVLHNFNFVNGAHPFAGLLRKGTTLYGVCTEGGNSGVGTVFKVKTDGTGFAILHNFAVGSGFFPSGRLIHHTVTDYLYGTTVYGGTNLAGTVFRIKRTGAGFSVVKNLTAAKGAYPYAGLVLHGGKLFGHTYSGGTSGLGTVFKLAISGTGYAAIHHFAGGAGDGENGNFGSLVSDGSFLYGMTFYGGASGDGTVYKINASGTSFSTLHEFIFTDGYFPYGGLLRMGSTLYGMCYAGGAKNNGVLFKIMTNGTGHTTLHDFDSAASGSYYPAGTPGTDGTSIFGSTYLGGVNAAGTVFKNGP